MSADVAVIIPTYNRVALLKRAIDSIQVQTCVPREIIVVDDGSDDETEAVVRQYSNCRYTKVAHSGLPALGRNVGVRITTATYVAFLDSDDEWFPHKLETQMSAIAATSSTLVCSNATLVASESSSGARPYFRTGQKHNGRVLKELLSENFVITSSVVVRRDLFESAGGFSEDPRLRGIEDYELWLRLAGVAEFHYIDAELLLYKHSVQSLSRSRSLLSHWQGMELIFAGISRAVERNDDGIHKVLNRQLALCRRSLCDEYLTSGQYRAFGRSFGGMYRRHPMAAVRYVPIAMRNFMKGLIR